MGSSEERLQKIAAGPQWSTEALDKVKAALDEFIEAFETAKKNPGWEGPSADAAVDRFSKLSSEAHDNLQVVKDLLDHIAIANDAIRAASEATGTLPEGSIDPGIKAAVVGGASIVLPGFGTVASVGALSMIEDAMSGGRENQAKAALEEYKKTTQDAATLVESSSKNFVVSDNSLFGDEGETDPSDEISHSSNVPGGGNDGGGGYGGGGGGYGVVGGGPDFPGGGPGGPGDTGGGSGGSGDGPRVTGPFDPPEFELPDDGFTPPTGPRPSVDGGIDGGTVGAPGAGGGGAHLGGLPGGAGGVSGAGGAGGASLGGAGLLGGAGGGAAMLAGARMASGGAGGAGGLGGGLLGAKAGMGGAGVGGASGSAGSAAGGTTSAGARGGTGMMGGGGARPGDEEEKERRGLGLFAPKLEDDDAAPAVPNAARAGSRPPKGAGS